MHSQKKILVVGQHFWPESFRVNDICDFLVERGCGVEVLCGLPNYPRGTFPEGYGYFKNRKQIHNNIVIHRAIEIPRGNNTNLRIFLNYISFPIASLFHIPRLLTKRFDKIFIYQLSPVMMSITGIIIGKLKHTETTMYVLDLWPENLYSVLNIKNSLLRGVAQKVSHWHYKHVDKLIVLSDKMQQRIIEITGKPKEKVIVLPQACEKLYERNIHDKVLASRFSRGFNVLFTGSITPAQSFGTIITAAKELRDSGINDINWIIVGDGMTRENVQAMVKDSSLEDCFFFEGQKPMEDIPKYTGIADILVGCLVKSDLLEATIPAKVMSYIASGKPMVLAMDGEVKNLITEKIRCGFVGHAGDSKAFAENVRKLHSLSRKELDEMGRRARDYHLNHFERNIILNKLYNFIFS
jgi:colanic acid biosynthesis glycosyl transferase WcaI